jgi:hypothetical protein
MLTTVSLRPERSRARASAVDERGVSPARSSARRAAGFVLATVAIALGVLALLLTAASAAAVDALVLGVRAAGTGAGLVAVGVLAFLVLVHDGHGREAADLGRLLRWAALTGIAAAVMRLPLEAATVAGTGLSGVTEPGYGRSSRPPAASPAQRCASSAWPACASSQPGPSSCCFTRGAGAALAVTPCALASRRPARFWS